MSKLSNVIERSIFWSRWLLAPLYLGLIGVLAVLAYKFVVEFIAMVQNVMLHDDHSFVLDLLALLDLVLMANHGGRSGAYQSAGRSAFWAPGGEPVVAAPGTGNTLVIASKGASAQEHDHAFLAERGQMDGPEFVQCEAGMARFILIYGSDVEVCSQFAKAWLEIRQVARSSIRPTSLMSGTLEQPTPWSIQRTT